MTTSLEGFGSCSTYVLKKLEQKEAQFQIYKHLFATSLLATAFTGSQLFLDTAEETKHLWMKALVSSVCVTFFSGIKALKLYAKLKAVTWIGANPAQQIQTVLDLEEEEGLISTQHRAARAIQLSEKMFIDARIIAAAHDANLRLRAQTLAESIE